MAIRSFRETEAAQVQRDWAESLGLPVESDNSLQMKLTLIPAGQFRMGSPDSDSDSDAKPNEKPQHDVRITRPFYLGKYEVTVAQFRQYIDESGNQPTSIKTGEGGRGYDRTTGQWVGANSDPDVRFSWSDPGFSQTENHPVVNVSWDDAFRFCKWLSKKEGRRYRLPTSAEWEYACRAGTTTSRYSGDDAFSLKEVANVADRSFRQKTPNANWTLNWDDGYPFAAPVGSFKPNAFGLYDMLGNVIEWCSDYHDENYYQSSPTDDPQGPATGSLHVMRSGSFYWTPPRSAEWGWNAPDWRGSFTGFRVVREIRMKPKPAERPPPPSGWQRFRSQKFGLMMLVPERFSSPLESKEPGGWKSLQAEHDGVEFLALIKLNEQLTRQQLHTAAASRWGVSFDDWEKGEAGENEKGWRWYETYYVSQSDKLWLAGMGTGYSGTYLVVVETTYQDYKANDQEYEQWLDSIELFDTGGPPGSPQSSTGPATVEEVAEINRGTYAAYPWLSPDGLTIYWEAGTGGNRSGIWTAHRATSDTKFANHRLLIEGRHCTISADGLEMIFLDLPRGGGPKMTLHFARRDNVSSDFSRHIEIAAFRNEVAAKSPFLSADGLTLIFNRANSSGSVGAELAISTRASANSRWSPARRLKINRTQLRDGFLTWAALSNDGRTLFCTNEGRQTTGYRERNLMQWTRGSSSGPFSNPRFVEFPGSESIGWQSPRYVEATDELFFTRKIPPKKSGQSWDSRIWVVKKFSQTL